MANVVAVIIVTSISFVLVKVTIATMFTADFDVTIVETRHAIMIATVAIALVDMVAVLLNYYCSRSYSVLRVFVYWYFMLIYASPFRLHKTSARWGDGGSVQPRSEKLHMLQDVKCTDCLQH